MKKLKARFGTGWLYLLGANTLLVVASLVLKQFLPPQIPLFYGYPQGEEELGPQISIVYPAITSTTILLINSLFTLLFEDKFLKRILIWASFVVLLLAAITTFKTLSLVGSFN